MWQGSALIRRVQKLAAYGASGFLLTSLTCWDSDIAKRFREGYGPGFVEGFSTFLTDPENAEAGLQQAGAAVFEGLGAVLNPRTGSSTSDSN
jgi:hypothetical protein